MGEGAPRESRKGSSRDYAGRSDREGRRDRDRDRESHRERRRSRSPEYRSSRRREDEPDAYSASRSHREREREDRYSGRDRRGGDREWDRERASDRSSRRDRDRDRDRRGGGGGADEENQSSRRERDGGFGDDRRRDRGGRDRRGGGGGGGGGGADEFPSNRDRDRRSASPPKKREPTPDLTDVVPVLERKRRMTQWDIKPPGYDNVTAEQAKMSGMFALPGAPRQQQQQVDPSRLQAFAKDPGNVNTPANNGASLKPTNARQSKRLIVSNLPPSATDESLQAFFNLQMNGLNVVEGTDPCVLAQKSKDGLFAIVEFRESSDATVALAFDGILMEASDTDAAADAAPAGLSIRRPKDYIVPDVLGESAGERGVVSNVVPDSPNKISICNIAPYFNEEQVTELIVSFGEVKAFVLVRDRHTEDSRGIAFCEYADASATDVAIQGLNGMDLGDKKLKVQKASCGITQVAGIEMGISAMSMLAGTTAVEPDETRVLQLLNMVTADELMNNDDYEEICEDVQDECSKFGTVLDLKIPRPSSGAKQSPGVGKIFVKFDSTEAAGKALRALAGRKFSDRTVVTTFFPEENFEVGLW